MYLNKKILALIPARGGSKGIKDKNIISLSGKPLIAYSIEAALKSKYIDKTVVTTDSPQIAKISKEYGASIPFLRPKELADDTSKTIDAVLHAVKELEKCSEFFDTIILLQPTQPLRTAEDIDRAAEQFFLNGEQSLASVSPVDDHPLLIRTVNKDGRLHNLINKSSTCRRQDMDDYYRINGCIYINSIASIDKNTSFNDNETGIVMDKKHSVDIDDMSDLALAEYYLNQK